MSEMRKDEFIMETKQKNILIGGLLAVVLVMAVGYAAFATNLNIGGTATIASSWDVRFDKTADSIEMTPGTLIGGGTGTMVEANQKIEYPTDKNDLVANLTADLIQPGDTVTFTLTIKNNGNLSARPGTPQVEIEGGEKVSNNVWKKGHIKYTITPPTKVLDENETDTVKVEAKFIDIDAEGNEVAENGVTSNLTADEDAEYTEQAVIGITITYTQAS